MRSPLLLAGLVLSSLTLTASPRRAPEPVWPHVIPSAGITIPPVSEGQGYPLTELLRDYSKLTDCHFLWSDDTDGLLKYASVALDRKMEVPAERLHRVVEAILIQNDFALTIRNEVPPYIVAVESLNTSARVNIRQRARYVPAGELDAWRDHPAYLIHTVIDLPHTDVRTLSNSMRAMLTDPITQAMIPVGNSNSLILTGFAPGIVELEAMLREVDQTTKRVFEQHTTPDEGAEDE